MSHRIPKYRKHRSGQARVEIRGKTFYLGKHGSAESRQEYKNLVHEHITDTGRFALTSATENVTQVPTGGASVNRVVLDYLDHAKVYYASNPKEYEKIKLATRPLRKLYGKTPGAVFDSLALEAVQTEMVKSGLARTSVNERIRVLKRLFKWGCRKKLVPASVLGELLLVDGLKRGRSAARETEPVRPVPEAHIGPVVKRLNRFVAAMVKLQLFTGARPGELCTIRRCDIDTGGKVWIYRPAQHKNQYRGQTREIYLGPQAQAIVKQFFRAEMDAYLFSPKVAREERFSEMRATRKSKVQPSQVCRKKPSGKRLPGERYTTYSYRRAICKACEAAEVPAWHPHQLRHNAATNLRKQFGVELARIILGHKTAFTTEIYAEADKDQAVEVMAKIG